MSLSTAVVLLQLLAAATAPPAQPQQQQQQQQRRRSAQRRVQIWVECSDAGFASLHSTLAQHKHNLTDIAPFGMLSHEGGKLVANRTHAARAKALGSLGLGVWPLLGGSLNELRAVLRRPTMIAEAVALAKAHGWASLAMGR